MANRIFRGLSMLKKKPPKAKRNPAPRKPREDTNQTACRVMQVVTKRSEG